ncbi:unnamed protein product [Brassica rapa subsp. trilocularis]
MASSKGKGILLEEDDDEPIQLPDQADEHLIREYNLSYKEGTSSYSRVKQSSHSSRVNRATNPRNSRYNPYSYVRKQDTAGRYQNASKERVWKEKQLRPLKINHQTRDTSSGSTGEGTKPRSGITGSIEPKSRTATEQPLIDINVTFRSNSSTRTLVSYVEATTEDLIPPYNALNAAMNECDNDNEEGDAADADMEEPIGNELMIMEEMTCWEKIL